MNFQDMINALIEAGLQQRKNYHATFGDLIDKLKNADDSLELSPKIIGVSAYRGYYSDIALCTSEGQDAYKNTNLGDRIEIDFTGTPKQLAEKLESLIGMYFDGYKGGFNKITKDTPMWVAEDYGNCSDLAVIEITDELELVTKEME